MLAFGPTHSSLLWVGLFFVTHTSVDSSLGESHAINTMFRQSRRKRGRSFSGCPSLGNYTAPSFSLPAANPSLTLVALSLRLTDHLQSRIS